MSCDLNELEDIENSLLIKDLVNDFLFAEEALAEDFSYELGEFIDGVGATRLESYYSGRLNAFSSHLCGKDDFVKVISLIGADLFFINSVNVDLNKINQYFSKFKEKDHTSIGFENVEKSELKKHIEDSVSFVVLLGGVGDGNHALYAKVGSDFLKQTQLLYQVQLLEETTKKLDDYTSSDKSTSKRESVYPNIDNMIDKLSDDILLLLKELKDNIRSYSKVEYGEDWS